MNFEVIVVDIAFDGDQRINGFPDFNGQRCLTVITEFRLGGVPLNLVLIVGQYEWRQFRQGQQAFGFGDVRLIGIIGERALPDGNVHRPHVVIARDIVAYPAIGKFGVTGNVKIFSTGAGQGDLVAVKGGVVGIAVHDLDVVFAGFVEFGNINFLTDRRPGYITRRLCVADVEFQYVCPVIIFVGFFHIISVIKHHPTVRLARKVVGSLLIRCRHYTVHRNALTGQQSRHSEIGMELMDEWYVVLSFEVVVLRPVQGKIIFPRRHGALICNRNTISNFLAWHDESWNRCVYCRYQIRLTVGPVRYATGDRNPSVGETGMRTGYITVKITDESDIVSYAVAPRDFTRINISSYHTSASGDISD